jgi:hypothetical protein
MIAIIFIDPRREPRYATLVRSVALSFPIYLIVCHRQKLSRHGKGAGSLNGNQLSARESNLDGSSHLHATASGRRQGTRARRILMLWPAALIGNR